MKKKQTYKGKLLTRTKIKNNILSIYKLSDKSDKLEGILNYVEYRNTIIITALANYYDYNDLPKEEGREVLRIIMDIQKQNRYERERTKK